MTVHELSRLDARRIAVRAQLLDSRRPTELLDAVRHLTLLQIDPIAAIAPSADLVAWSRLGSSYSPAERVSVWVCRRQVPSLMGSTSPGAVADAHLCLADWCVQGHHHLVPTGVYSGPPGNSSRASLLLPTVILGLMPEDPTPPSRKSWWRRRRTWRRAAVVAVLGALVASLTTAASVIWVGSGSNGHIFTEQTVPSAPVALVLGAQVNPDATPSPFLAARLDLARRLLAAGKVRAIATLASALGIDPTREHLTASLLVVPIVLLVAALFFLWGARRHSN